MKLDVLVEPAAGGGFVARSGAPFDLTAAAATAAEAVGTIRRLADERVRGGAHVVQVPVGGEPTSPPEPRAVGVVTGPPPGVDPWLHMAGIWKDDPEFDQFLAAIEQYREECETDPNR